MSRNPSMPAHHMRQATTARPSEPGQFAQMAQVIDEVIAHHQQYRELDVEWLAETARRLRSMDGTTIREWGACDLRDDPNDETTGDGVEAADDEHDAEETAASWSTGRVCWRDVTYGRWVTRAS